jgi:hypothetical protein
LLPHTHLCWELLLRDVWQHARSINVHGVAAWWLHDGHTRVTQQPSQQLNLPAEGEQRTSKCAVRQQQQQQRRQQAQHMVSCRQ